MWRLLLLCLPVAAAFVPVRPNDHAGWLMAESGDGRLAAYWDVYTSSSAFSFSESIDVSNTTDDAVHRMCTLRLDCVGYHYLGEGLGRLFVGLGNRAPENDGAGYIKMSATQTITFDFLASPSPGRSQMSPLRQPCVAGLLTFNVPI